MSLFSQAPWPRASRILGTGLGVPSRVVSNADLSKTVETSDEWIFSRTGIRSRRVVDRDKGETNSTLSIAAASSALKNSNINATDLDFIICCTATPDTWMPITAARIAHGIGAASIATFDLNAACSGFLTGLSVADTMLRSGSFKRGLVIGSDIFSSILDWTDRRTCVLFGDGSGAAVVEGFDHANPKDASMILGFRLYTDFDVNEDLAVKGGGSRSPQGSSSYMKTEFPFVNMNGKEIFKAGSRGMAEATKNLCHDLGVSISDLKWLVPHQANSRIMEMVAKLLDVPLERVFMNVDQWGNTSAGTIAIALAEMQRDQKLKRGDLVMLSAFGGGFTYGAMLLRW